MKKVKKTNTRARTDNTHYNNLFENGVNFKERVIYINEEIGDGTLDLVMKALDEMERGEGSERPIRVEVSSFGGSVYDMLGCVDRIISSPCQVITRGFGKIMSAASFILAAGDERVMGNNSWMMIHELSDFLGRAKLSDHKHDVKHSEQLQDQMYALFARLSSNGTTKSTFKKACQKDHYMTAEDALNYGLIDKVIGFYDYE